MEHRTLGAILGQDKSIQGGYYFMNFLTGARIHMRSWSEVPIPDEVIARVESMAKKDDVPLLESFGDRHGYIVPEDQITRVEDNILSDNPSTESIMPTLQVMSDT